LVIGALSHVVALDKKDRDEYFQKRDMIATKMIPAQIIEAQKLAREWKPTMQPPRYSPWMLGRTTPASIAGGAGARPDHPINGH
jgi:hypothetical protein